MKIAFISPHTFSYPGGVQKHTLALKGEFEKKGHQVKLIFPREEFPQKKDKDTILLGGALYMPGNASRINLSLNITPLAIYQKLRKENFDILHFQNFGVFLPWQILEVSTQFPKRPSNILTFHAFLDASRLFKELPTLIKVLNGYIIPKFDGVITVSRPVLSQLEYKGPTRIIPNGVDTIFFRPGIKKIKKFAVSKSPSDLEYTNILFVGRIEKRKGLIYLVKAFEVLRKKYKNIRLIVVGKGGEENKIKDYIKRHRIFNVFFEGEVKEKDLPKYYSTADICCFPSTSGEAFGMVLLEAMASARPVVAFANQGYKEVLTGKGAKFLAEPKNDQELAKRLDILIKNKKLRGEMGRWGQKEAKKYSWDKIAGQTLKFYDEVMQKQRSHYL
jgi:phosphatidylinositol alpha-mannosyltransferase